MPKNKLLENFIKSAISLRPVILNKHDGVVTQALYPIGEDRAVLQWIFDVFAEDFPTLLVSLTDTEAQKIYEADWRIGLLEPVRGTLENNNALITLKEGLSKFREVEIPRYSTEEVFSKFLLEQTELLRKAF